MCFMQLPGQCKQNSFTTPSRVFGYMDNFVLQVSVLSWCLYISIDADAVWISPTEVIIPLLHVHSLSLGLVNHASVERTCGWDCRVTHGKLVQHAEARATILIEFPGSTRVLEIRYRLFTSDIVELTSAQWRKHSAWLRTGGIRRAPITLGWKREDREGETDVLFKLFYSISLEKLKYYSRPLQKL